MVWMDVWGWFDGFGAVGMLVVGSVGVLERAVDVEVGGGCWWESRGEESAYEVVAGCRERERAIRQKRVQAASAFR
jgi:hypothetical protein